MDETQTSHEQSAPLEITSIADQGSAMLCERTSVLDPDPRRQFPIDMTQGANPQGDEVEIDPINSQDDVPQETFVPDAAVTLQLILRTEELINRPSRPPDYKSENAALSALASALKFSAHHSAGVGR